MKQKLDYENKILQFKQNLIIYQQAASQTILSINTTGDSESFYAHVLFNYIPQLVDKIWQ